MGVPTSTRSRTPNRAALRGNEKERVAQARASSNRVAALSSKRVESRRVLVSGTGLIDEPLACDEIATGLGVCPFAESGLAPDVSRSVDVDVGR